MEKLIFVSYNQLDSQFVLQLADDLAARGINIWLDKRNIAPGARWDEEIEKALTASEIFMVILSPASVASENVRDEVSFAIEAHKRVIPVIARQCDIPFRLKRFQYIDFSRDYSGAVNKLHYELAAEFRQAGISTEAEKINIPGSPKIEPKKNASLKYFLIVFASVAVIVVLFLLSRSGGNDREPIPDKGPVDRDEPGPGPAVQGDIIVNFNANPVTIPAGEQSTLNVRVFTPQNVPLANANIKLEIGGGFFTSSGTATEIGHTNQDGVFITNWISPIPAAPAYVCLVTVSKEGFAERKRELTIFIKN